jgi:hypothetical protein
MVELGVVGKLIAVVKQPKHGPGDAWHTGKEDLQHTC